MVFTLFKRKFFNYIILIVFTAAFFTAPRTAYAAAGDGLLSYGLQNGQKYRTWTPSTWGNETTTGLPQSVITNWTVLKASPVNAGVYVMAMVTTEATNNFKVYSYSGGTWTAEFTATQSSTQYAYRLFDVAFENSSGNVLVVYGTSASTTTVYYQEGTWNGTDYNWTSGSFSFTTSIGNLRWFVLANKLNSNEMILLAVGDGGTNNINAQVWNGSSFGNEPSSGWGLAGYTTNWSFDAAYETASGEGMVAWGVSASPYWKYATYVSGTWTVNNGPTTNLGAGIRVLALDGDPTSTSNLIAGGLTENAQNDVNGVVWSGSAWTGPTSLDPGVFGDPTGRQVDVKYVQATGNAILVYDDDNRSDLSWARSTGGGAFALQTEVAINGDQDSNIQLVSESADDKVMYVRLEDRPELYAYYYDDSTNSWTSTNGGNPLEANPSGGINRESYMFAYQSVYQVPTLGVALTLIAVASFIAVLVRKKVLHLKPTPTPA